MIEISYIMRDPKNFNYTVYQEKSDFPLGLFRFVTRFLLNFDCSIFSVFHLAQDPFIFFFLCVFNKACSKHWSSVKWCKSKSWQDKNQNSNTDSSHLFWSYYCNQTLSCIYHCEQCIFQQCIKRDKIVLTYLSKSF